MSDDQSAELNQGAEVKLSAEPLDLAKLQADWAYFQDKISPLPWSDFAESDSYWIESADPEGMPLGAGHFTTPKDGYVTGANDMSASNMGYTVWAANNAPRLLAELVAAGQRSGRLHGLLSRVASILREEENSSVQRGRHVRAFYRIKQAVQVGLDEDAAARAAGPGKAAAASVGPPPTAGRQPGHVPGCTCHACYYGDEATS